MTRITVTLSIFNFRTWFFEQIVENRETRLSGPFLGPGDIFFEKLWRKQICMAAVWHLRSAHQTRACVDTVRPNLGFVITFKKKMPPGLKNGLESCVSRFSTICAKNLALKLKIDEVTVIRVSKSPLWAAFPCSTRVHCCLEPRCRMCNQSGNFGLILTSRNLQVNPPTI